MEYEMFLELHNKEVLLMKKIISLILCILLCGSAMRVFGENAINNLEVIPKENFSTPLKRDWTGRDFTFNKFNPESKEYERYISEDGFVFKNSGLPSYIAQKEYLIWSNGTYIALDSGRFVPDNHFNKIDYTSPYYVLDENFNLIKQVEYPGRIVKHAFVDGVFYYITQERVVDRLYIYEPRPSDFRYIYHKTSDFVNIESIENDSALLYDMVPVYSNSLKENAKHVVYEKKYGNSFIGANFYYTHANNQYSLDGIYFQEFPVDIDEYFCTNGWYKDGYLYLETETQYYKLKVDWPDYTYIKLDDKILAFEQPPVVENDRTLVPMRFLFEQLGDSVAWDEETQTVTASNESNTVTFSIGSRIAEVNNAPITMDVPAQLIGDKTYVPLRFLSENLGYTVSWDEETRTASVITE